VRYRVLALAFAATVAVAPLAVVTSAFRTAPSGAGPSALAPAGVAGPALGALAAVASALLLRLVFDVVKLRRVKRGASVLGTVAVRRAMLGTSPAIATPTAIGYLHPAVVVPVDFRSQVDEREWEAVVAHECAHLARLDDWAKALQSAAVRLCWWMPGLWLLGRALDLERELASDDAAAARTGSRRYAACLLRLATDRRGREPAPAFGARRAHVAIRVERLLRPVRGTSPLLRAVALGAATAAAFGVVGAAVLAVPGTHRPDVAAPHRVAALVRPPARALATRPQRPAARRAALGAAAARPAAAPHPAAVASVALAAPVRAHAAVTAAARPAPHPHRRIARAALPPAETLALVASPRRCATCYGPLRSPDGAMPSDASVHRVPAAGPLPSAAAVAVDDPAAGPVTLNGPQLWLRMPVRALLNQ
jgi:beta-lactamase regulating signal transducer with metallopeptidase domain